MRARRVLFAGGAAIWLVMTLLVYLSITGKVGLDPAFGAKPDGPKPNMTPYSGWQAQSAEDDQARRIIVVGSALVLGAGVAWAISTLDFRHFATREQRAERALRGGRSRAAEAVQAVIDLLLDASAKPSPRVAAAQAAAAKAEGAQAAAAKAEKQRAYAAFDAAARQQQYHESWLRDRGKTPGEKPPHG